MAATREFHDLLHDPVHLAIAVLRERVRELPSEDREDLYELTKALFAGDDEEQQSAAMAMHEILEQAKGTVSSMALPGEPGSVLESWTGFAGKRIREEREKAGLTQDELALKAGLPQSHISKLETSKHSPTSLTLEKIAKALAIPAATFDPSA